MSKGILWSISYAVGRLAALIRGLKASDDPLPRSDDPLIFMLPILHGITVDVPAVKYRSTPTVAANLETMECDCDYWKRERHHKAPIGSVGRCRRHLCAAFSARVVDRQDVHPWTKRILEACVDYGPPPFWEYACFTNGEHNFLALYDLDRGYVQLYGPTGTSQYGYDSLQNHWAHGYAPEKPLTIKKHMRPWIAAMNKKYGHGG